MARILIAEDDDAVRSLVVRALSDDGHELTTAADGAAALDALTQHNGEFDLLLTDLMMPVMDGLELALATGHGHPQIAIMLMTGYAEQRERAQGLDALVQQIKVAVREALVQRH
jgi:two-component system cell cycle response regulator CpdR